MRNFDVDQTAFIQGQCGYTFLFLVGVKVVIGTVERCLLLGKKIEVVVDPSLIACVCVYFTLKFVQSLYLTECAWLAFLDKYSTLTHADNPAHCRHFSGDED